MKILDKETKQMIIGNWLMQMHVIQVTGMNFIYKSNFQIKIKDLCELIRKEVDEMEKILKD